MRKTVLATLFLTICAVLAAQQAMNNDAVIKMVKAGLSDDIIVGSISSQPGQYDTSADGLIALKTAGASDKVVAAMISKASGVAAPAAAAAPAPSNGLPPGIDEIGVYIQDKSGNWVSLMPEVVNFKTGGVLKSLATNGLVKGDINGHIEGPKAKTTATLPVVFAVYTQDGTAITEYQLLRLRVNSDNREFRSAVYSMPLAAPSAIQSTSRQRSLHPASTRSPLTRPWARASTGFSLRALSAVRTWQAPARSTPSQCRSRSALIQAANRSRFRRQIGICSSMAPEGIGALARSKALPHG